MRIQSKPIKMFEQVRECFTRMKILKNIWQYLQILSQPIQKSLRMFGNVIINCKYLNTRGSGPYGPFCYTIKCNVHLEIVKWVLKNVLFIRSFYFCTIVGVLSWLAFRWQNRIKYLFNLIFRHLSKLKIIIKPSFESPLHCDFKNGKTISFSSRNDHENAFKMPNWG